MTVEIGSVYRQDLSIPPRVENNPRRVSDGVDQPDYLALLKRAKEKKYSITPLLSSLEKRPLEPIEPEPFKCTAAELAEYTVARDKARAYEAENSLRGTF